MKKRYSITINRYDPMSNDYVFYQTVYFNRFIDAHYFSIGFGFANDVRYIVDAMRSLYQLSPIKKLKGGVHNDKDTK